MANNVTVDFTANIAVTDPLGVGIVCSEFGGNPVPLVSNTGGWHDKMVALAPGVIRCSVAWYAGNPGYGAGGSSRTPGSAAPLISAIKSTGAIPLVSFNGDSADNHFNPADGGSLVHYFNDAGGQHNGPVRYFSIGNEADDAGDPNLAAYQSASGVGSAPATLAAMLAADSTVWVGAPATASWNTGVLTWAASATNLPGLKSLSWHEYDGANTDGTGFPANSNYAPHVNIARNTYFPVSRGLVGIEECNWDPTGGTTPNDWRNVAFIADVSGRMLAGGGHLCVYGDSNGSLGILSDGTAGAVGTPMAAYYGLGIWTGMNGQFKRWSANMVSASTTLSASTLTVYACDNGKIVAVNKTTSAQPLTIGMTLAGGVTVGTYNVWATSAAGTGGPITQVVTGAAFTASTISYTVPASTVVSIDVTAGGSGTGGTIAVNFTSNIATVDPLGVGITISGYGAPSAYILNAAWKNALASLAPGHCRVPMAWFAGNPGFAPGGAPQAGTATAVLNAITSINSIPFVTFVGDSSDNGFAAADAGSFVHWANDGGGQHGGPVKYWVIGNEADNVQANIAPYEAILPPTVAAMHGADATTVLSMPAAGSWDTSFISAVAGTTGLGILSYHAYDGGNTDGTGWPTTLQYYTHVHTDLPAFRSGVLYGVEEVNWHFTAGSTAFFDFRNTLYIADVAGHVISAGGHFTQYADSNGPLGLMNDGSGQSQPGTLGTTLPAYWGVGLWTGMNGQFKRYGAHMVSATTSFAETSLTVYACDNGKIVAINKTAAAQPLAITVTLPGGVTSGSYVIWATNAAVATSPITQVVTSTVFGIGNPSDESGAVVTDESGAVLADETTATSLINYTIPANTAISIDVTPGAGGTGATGNAGLATAAGTALQPAIPGAGGITVVQSATSKAVATVTFPNPVSPGNSVLLVAGCFNTDGTTMSSTTPTLGGTPVAFAQGLTAPQQSPAGAGGYEDMVQLWLLPNLPGTSGTIGISFASNAGISGLWAIEVAGLGAAPVAGSSGTGNGIIGTTPSIGPLTPNAVPAITIAAITQTVNNFITIPAPWNGPVFDSGWMCGGTITESSGASLTFTPGISGAAGAWAAAICPVYAAVSATAPAGLAHGTGTALQPHVASTTSFAGLAAGTGFVPQPSVTGTGPLLQLANSFEGGSNGVMLTGGPAGNTGGASGNFFDTVTVGAGNFAEFSAAGGAHGTNAVIVQTGAGAGIASFSWNTSLGLQTTLAGRVYLNILSGSNQLSAPDAIIQCHNSGAAACNIQLTIARQLSIQDAVFATVFTLPDVIPLGQWVRIEWLITFSPTAGQITVAYYASKDATVPTDTFTSGAVNNFGTGTNSVDFGWTNSHPSQPPIEFDDVLLSTATILPGPAAVTISAGLAAGTGTAQPPAIAAPAGLAHGTGTAQNATVPAAGFAGLANDFSEGTNGVTLTHANTAGTGQNAFDTVTVGTGATVAFSNVHAIHSPLSALVTTAGAAAIASFSWNASLGIVTSLYGRTYVWLTAAATVNDAVWQHHLSSNPACNIQIDTGAKIEIQDAGFASIHTFVNAIPLNAWTRIEWHVVFSPTAGQITVSFYPGDSLTATETYIAPASQNFGTGADTLDFGWTNAHAAQPAMYLANPALSTTGPLGPATAVNAPAGLAAGTGTALQPAAPARAGLAAGVGIALQPTVAAPAVLAVSTGTALQPAVIISGGATTSPGLRVSGFGSFPQVPNGAVILSVIANVSQYSSDLQTTAPSYELWDGTTAIIGTAQTGTVSTSTSNVDTVVFTGISYSQLTTLQLRIYAGSQAANSGATVSVDAVALVVTWGPPAGKPGVLAVIPKFPVATAGGVITAAVTPGMLAVVPQLPPAFAGVQVANILPPVLAPVTVLPGPAVSTGMTASPFTLATVPVFPAVSDPTVPGYATAQGIVATGSGSWANPVNVVGPPDGSVATWTVP